MLTIRKSNERGHADHGWLDSYHSFSFANYYDAEHMGYRSLRVINEDWIEKGRGFGAHPHRDMEILTYVLSGQLAHKDSMGHTETLGANEIQKMSAGTGVVHSEFNPSETEPVHLLQIWIIPETRGLTPAYEQYKFEPEEKLNRFKVLASPNPPAGAATMHQDAKISVAELTPGKSLTYPLGSARHAWLQVVRGEVTANGKQLNAGDAVALDDEQELTVAATGAENSEVLLFDLA
ncbi:quercetin 2,3-dioxygenase [Edaphobacter acidisoli]|uniref:Quercetin 2,3-dioxygenase n=1 Tax=Edaphobacter acidisoli TaxID=2040573 RepID=A0A916RTQ3_9BACT|nr:pirin family protein [Edaphobacter acidisoli]GGA69264.1 quercetin 2,3-dioxygenase [Edaphobacter acidisoli]